MANQDDITKRAALRLLNNGRLTIAEVARASGMSRQLVRYWAESDGLDGTEIERTVVQKRRKNIKKIWEREISRLSE